MRIEWHADQAARLFKAVGSREKVADILGVSEAHTYRFTNPNNWTCMNAMQISKLENHIGEPLYSAKLAQLLSGSIVKSDIMHCAGEVSELAGTLVKRVIGALADGKLSPREMSEIRQAIYKLQEPVSEMEAALGDDEKKVQRLRG